MKKGFLAFLAALMLLTSMPVGAEETAAEVQSNAMRFAQALGIMDETYAASEAISRRQLAQCYYNILLNGADITGFEENIFTDVSAEDTAAVTLCYHTGIMTGTGETTFSPDAPVTYMQLVKTMVSFLGYDAKAQAEGGWPYGYIAAASSLGLYKDAPADAGSYVTANKAAKLFRSSADISLMRRSSYGTNEFEIKYGATWIKLYRSLEQYRGTVKANHMTDLGGKKASDYDRVTVDNTEYLLADGAIDLKDYIGYRVDIYVNTDTEPGTIVYWELREADKVVIDGNDVIGYDNYKLSYYGDGGRNYLPISNETWVVYNGSLCGTYDESVMNPFADSYKDGSITALDNDGDGVYDFVEIDAYDTYVVSAVLDGKIFVKYRTDVMIDTDALREEHMMVTNVVGEEMWLSAIVPGTIISVSRDLSGTVKRIVGTIDTVRGKVTEIETGNGMKITLGDITYDCANCLPLNDQLADMEVGDTVKLFFNKDGKVSDIEADEFRSYLLGYLTDAGTVDGISTDYEVKIFTSGGKFEIYSLADKVEVEGVGTKKAAEAVALAGTVEESGRVRRQLIQYQVNADTNKLNYIDYCEGSEPSDSLYRYEDYKDTYYYNRNFGGKLILPSTAKLFSIPKEDYRDDDESYYLTDTSGFSTGTNYASSYLSFEAYGNKKDSRCAIALVLERNGKRGYWVSTYTNLFTVGKITQTVDTEGESALKVTGVLQGAVKTYYAKAEDLKVAPGGGLPKTGDVLRVVTDSKQYIRGAEFIFSESSRTFNGMSNPSDKAQAAKRFVYGKVLNNENGCITIDVDGDEEVFDISSYKMACYKKNAAEGADAETVTVGAQANIYDEKQYPGIGSWVLIHTNLLTAKSLVIFNE